MKHFIIVIMFAREGASVVSAKTSEKRIAQSFKLKEPEGVAWFCLENGDGVEKDFIKNILALYYENSEGLHHDKLFTNIIKRFIEASEAGDIEA